MANIPANNTVFTTTVVDQNVRFLNGTQARLDPMLTEGGAIQGAFYLTSDTHRLYIGQSDGKGKVVPVPVNQGVTTVKDVQALHAEAGAFYYVESENILCVYNGTQWVQINPDHNDNTVNKAFTTTLSDHTDGSNNIDGVTFTQQVIDTENKAVTTTFAITSDGGIDLSFNGTVLKLKGCVYSLGVDVNDMSKTATITLSGDSDDIEDTTIGIKAGSLINITKEAGKDNVIVVSGVNQYNTGVSAGNGNGGYTGAGASAPASNIGFHFTVKDGNGTKGAAIDPVIRIGETGKEIDYHFGSSVPGVAVLPVYTQAEIDKKLVGLDAMRYMGTVGTGGSRVDVPNGAVGTNNSLANCVKIGDTYLVVGAGKKGTGSSAGITVKTGTNTTTKAYDGDLIIARGTEDTNSSSATYGYITSATLVWDVVPSGDDKTTDTNYYGNAVTGGLQIKDSVNDQVRAEITVEGDNYLKVSSTPASTGYKNGVNDKQKLTISHSIIKESDRTDEIRAMATQAENSTFDIPAVTGVNYDAAGHVTGLVTQTFRVRDTVSKINTLTYAATNTKNASTGEVTATIENNIITQTAGGTNISNKKASFAVKSSTLEISTSGSAVTMNLVWDQF